MPGRHDRPLPTGEENPDAVAPLSLGLAPPCSGSSEQGISELGAGKLMTQLGGPGAIPTALGLKSKSGAV